MATAPKKVDLSYRSTRAKLTEQREPYWHRVKEGVHLGYRKLGFMRGSWIVRYYTPQHGRRWHHLGTADDTVTADGKDILSFDNAVDAAQKWVADTARADGAGVHYGPYKVKDAAAAWLARYSGSLASKSNAESNVKHHILPTLGEIEVAKLTRAQVQDWLIQLAQKPPLKVQRRLAPDAKKLPPSRQSKIVYDANDPETIRKRRDTANRIFNDLSALLTQAYEDDYAISKAAWEKVEKFENVAVAKNEYLTAEEGRKFLEACPSDFRDLVYAALITGCRYGELARLKVSAYDVQNRSISLKQSKTGKVKRAYLTDEEAEYISGHIKGKGRDAFMFLKADGEEWNKSNQQKRMKTALQAAGIKRPVRFHDLRHTFASLLAMSGTSIQLIANQLGHSGTRIAEQHYAHLSPEHIAAQVRANKPSFGFAA